MNSANVSAEALRNQIAAAETDLNHLKEQLANIEANDATLETLSIDDHKASIDIKWPFSQEEYQRYGRQMIVPSMGIQSKIFPHKFLYLKTN